MRAKRVSVPSHRPFQLPGFLPALGFTWLYLGTLVLFPLGYLLVRAAAVAPERLWELVSDRRTLAALRLSLTCAVSAATINVVLGTLVAWVLARFQFRGRTLLDNLVELPFALPTSVAGITLTFLYSEHGWMGQFLARFGIRIAFTPLGVVVALTFVGLPFVVRAVQPVVEEMDAQLEEAAALLSATPIQIFLRVQFPLLLPAMVTGFAMALARALGEYGSVLFISGNLPFRTEVAPLLIVSKLEQFDYDGAAVLAAGVLLTSFALLLAVHAVERVTGRRFAGREGAT